MFQYSVVLIGQNIVWSSIFNCWLYTYF